MHTEWKSSLIEPSNEMSKIFELIFNENGKLTRDWEGKNNVNYKEIGEAIDIINEQCGGHSHGSCGINNDYNRMVARRANIGRERVMSKISTVEDLLNNLYNFYKDKKFNNLIKRGDTVIYHNPGHKHNEKEFEYLETREDGKLKLKSNNLIFYAVPDRVTKKDASGENKSDRFNRLVDFMIQAGDIDRETAETFIKHKTIDPYDEEDWTS